MTLQTRILLLVTSLLVVVVVGTTAALTWATQRSLVEQAEVDGRAIASLMARSAGFAESVPEQVEEVIGDQMVVSATVTSHLVAVAEAAGMSTETIDAMLEAITASTVLDEIWVTDETGYAYLTTEDVEFTFSPDPVEQPQASAFWALIEGDERVVVQDAMVREIDASAFKYVGVAGVDKPRIVEVGTNANLLDHLEQEMGPARLADEIVASGAVSSIHILDHNFATIASSGVSADIERSWEQVDRQLRGSITAGEMMTLQGDDMLEIAAPVLDQDGRVTGAVLVTIPTTSAEEAMRDAIILAIIVALVVLAMGAIASVAIARWVSLPVAKLTTAAEAVEGGTFDPDSLERVANRQDGLGQLARVFQTMAVEVRAREERLKKQVRELRIEIDRKQEARQVAEIIETDYFQDLQARAQQLRQRSTSARQEES